MATEQLARLTLLHSNDIHGDFDGMQDDEKHTGGISRLSGYVARARASDPATLYCIAGDMLQGSLIDTEYRGISTIEIMNCVNPDIVCLGNHEIDYGLGHLLFLERCARFPIVCANLFVKQPRTRLFSAHKTLTVNGVRIMFIGIITREVLSSLKTDNLISTLVDVDDAAQAVGRITNAYKTMDVDLTVVLSHIGFEEDKQMAALLDPSWGVDIIIGGHSHSYIDQPAEVNGVLIATAGHGTEQIGRFDLVVDTAENRVHSYEWKLVPIDPQTTPRDEQLDTLLAQYQQTVDAKYDAVVCRFARALTHPSRYQETELGNLVADSLKDCLGLDLMMVGSGSIRQPQLGPLVTKGGLLAVMPFDDKVQVLRINGDQLRRMVLHMLRDEALDGGHGEFYQFSRGMVMVYDRATHSFERFEYQGHELSEDDVLQVGLQTYHFINFDEFFAVPRAELVDGTGRVLTTSQRDVLEEFWSHGDKLTAQVEGRLVIK